MIRLIWWMTVFVRPRQLSRGALHAQVELLATKLEEFLGQFFHGLISQIFGIHHITCRETNVVENGSLRAARRNASRAISSLTPSIS